LGSLAAAMTAGAGVVYLTGSYFAATPLAEVLISPSGLTPGDDQRQRFLAALREKAQSVSEFTHPGDKRDPVNLRTTFATPGDPGHRPTILFLHGKGGNAAEWQPDALRALEMGFNVLCPDLRGHSGSGGRFVTYGFLEKGDLEIEIRTAAEKFGLDPARLGVHACSAGSTIALQFTAANPSVRALWLESPWGDPKAMARHYLHLTTGMPRWALGLTTKWAMARAVERIRTELHLEKDGGIDLVNPVEAARKIRCPVALIYGRKDELVPPDLVPALQAALPRYTSVWEVGDAGHCHHADEPEAVERAEYEKRWREFFGKNLTAAGNPPPAP
jgi:pimeloyl-ACP methyl ester carboxylesterase